MSSGSEEFIYSLFTAIKGHNHIVVLLEAGGKLKITHLSRPYMDRVEVCTTVSSFPTPNSKELSNRNGICKKKAISALGGGGSLGGEVELAVAARARLTLVAVNPTVL